MDVSGWTFQWKCTFSKGSHELDTEYGAISDYTTNVGSNTFTTYQLQAGWYKLYIEVKAMRPSDPLNNTGSFTLAGTFDIEVVE